MNHNKGFTLIETVIYIGLFTILMGTGFIAVYNLIEGSNRLNTRAVTAEEGNFVLRKINWALTGISVSTADITSPSTALPYLTNNTLTIKRWYGSQKIPVTIQYNSVSKSIEMSENGTALIPITTPNVTVTLLQFKYLPPTSTSPAGIKATMTINGTTFAITKFIRK